MQACVVAHNLHTRRLVVTVHSYDLETFSDPGSPTIALFDEVHFDGRSASVLSELNVHRVSDLAALEALAASTTLDGVVAEWRTGLADLTMRLRTRLIVVAPTLPEGLVDAVNRGIDARWARNAADAAVELRQLRITRPTDNVRHRFLGVGVRFAGGEAQLHDLSNDGLAFDIADADVERLLPGRALEDLVLVRGGQVCLRGVRALVRHLGRRGDRALSRRLRVEARRSPRRSTVTQIRDRALCAALIKTGRRRGIIIAPHRRRCARRARARS